MKVEDPAYILRGDVKDVTANVARSTRISQPVLIPMGRETGGSIYSGFEWNARRHPGSFCEALWMPANAQFPFQYRLDADGNWFTITPTHTRDQLGHSVSTVPLLDRHITIPPGTRPIMQSASLMADALSAQTGLRVSCCQATVAGIPWGPPEIFFEANDEPARSVLKRLFTAAAINQPDRDYWIQRCDPLPSAWCFINLAQISRAMVATSTSQPIVPQGTQPSPFLSARLGNESFDSKGLTAQCSILSGYGTDRHPVTRCST